MASEGRPAGIDLEVDFLAASTRALGDPQLRRNFRRAMDGLMAKRAAAFPDPAEWARLRALGAAIRAKNLARLPELLETLERNLARNGIATHWARDPGEANGIVLRLLQARGARAVVKGKSMVSEEMGLNHHLRAHGIEALESDLGEYIIQLDGEMPSHIIMPAIHKDKDQIARLFSQRIKDARYTEEVDQLTAMARAVLRRKFEAADAGLSGVNFAVAETGTLCLVENEGNGRMSTHVPDLHIALMGLEKVVERLDEVAPLYSLLTRSATGQAISTYFNLISGPRGAGELDGPREVHLVILDNGRSRIFQDPELAATLACIRCGACMNHCPVYTRIGGHAYQAVYPGPIGAILTPQLEGAGRRAELPEASSLCGACAEVCPVAIPITHLLIRLRREASHRLPGATVAGAGAARSGLEALAWRVWAWVMGHPAAYRCAAWCAARCWRLLPAGAPPLRAWTATRSRPVPARTRLAARVRARGVARG